MPRAPVCRRLFSASSTRSVEWLMTLFMLGWAITLVMPGDTLRISSYRAFTTFGLNDTNMAAFYGCLAVVRIILLASNGSFRRGPEVRFFYSAIGAFTWFVTAALFTLSWLHGAPLPVAASHQIIMCAAEFYTIEVNAVDRHTGR